MTLAQAEAVTIPFGSHKGQRLGDIAEDDLLYLDWLNGKDIRNPIILKAVAAICAARAAEIEQAIDAREER